MELFPNLYDTIGVSDSSIRRSLLGPHLPIMVVTQLALFIQSKVKKTDEFKQILCNDDGHYPIGTTSHCKFQHV
ncbi:hypothetical protein EG68_07559 [Paragonimus skrjabini miyazakii]|uniref:Uncharacterized protein n=1 Tax=Paragonimus skrjabini miyazakii TaxID=59628 RepID=A0A8S9YSC1_9TREM|nr:hypothetical protein EG68_07559 [Paragonimus skrjabini miyazakii]